MKNMLRTIGIIIVIAVGILDTKLMVEYNPRIMAVVDCFNGFHTIERNDNGIDVYGIDEESDMAVHHHIPYERIENDGLALTIIILATIGGIMVTDMFIMKPDEVIESFK